MTNEITFIYEYKSQGVLYWTKKLIARDYGSFVACEYFFLRNGEWERSTGKGIRLIKKVKASSKGRYIIFEGERRYL